MSARTPRSLRTAGLVGLVATAVLVALALNVARLPVIGDGGRELSAQVTDASGLEAGDRVEVAGVRVGSVDGLDMGPGYVTLRFTLTDDVHLGADTTARIKVSNLLGSKYLELEPAGTGELTGTIPLARTHAAYDVTTAFADLTETLDPIDTDQMARALDALDATLSGAGPDIRASLDGLSRLSRSVASRDEQVASLLDHAEGLSATLDDSKADLTALARDAARLLTAVEQRRDAVHGLIVHTRELAEQVGGLIEDNQRDLTPMLDDLDTVTAQLQRRQAALRSTLRHVATFARVFVNTVGGGPWFDSYIANAPNSLELEDPQ